MTEVIKQGLHPDPAVDKVPPPAEMTQLQRRAVESAITRRFRECLAMPGQPDLRSAVLQDLAEYHGIPIAEALRRCLDWEAESVAEWRAADRSTDAGLREFYNSLQSWTFDLSWYALLQATGLAYPVQPIVAAASPRADRPLRHLDFGSGVGTMSQLFRRLGYVSDGADVSRPLLEFARFRTSRRDELINFVDLNCESLPPGEYDVITAVDTLVHVPDLRETVTTLHRSLKPNGVLFANFDTRPPSAENSWHLYSDDLPLRWTLQRAGFEPMRNYDGYITKYRRVDNSGLEGALRGGRDLVMLRSPLRPTVRRAKKAARRIAAARCGSQLPDALVSAADPGAHRIERRAAIETILVVA
jgi:SAM-dependent methyltransferase